MARDPASRVIPRVDLTRVVHAHGDHVDTRHQLRRDVVPLARVPVWPMSHLGAVHPDVGVHVHAVELEPRATSRRAAGQRETLAIPADPHGEKAAATQRRVRLRVRPFDAPVVRHVDRAPSPVVERGRLGAGRVATQEAPLGIERPALALCEGRRRGEQCGERGDDVPRCDRSHRATMRAERRRVKATGRHRFAPPRIGGSDYRSVCRYERVSTRDAHAIAR